MARSVKEELGQIVIRPAPGMREKIKELADSRGRSMNAEIVEALSGHIERADLEAAGWAWTPPHHRIDPDLLESLERMADGREAEVRLLIRKALTQFIVREVATDQDFERDLKGLVVEIVDLVRYQLQRQAEREEEDREPDPA